MKDNQPAHASQAANHPVVVRRRDRLSRFFIWLVPIGVILLCGYLVQHNILSAGPRIRIAFSGDVPVEEEKTPLRYKGVEIGRVKKVSLTTDFRQVIVEAQLQDFAKDFATQGAQFWIVRPRITATGVQGIETLTSGAYIAATPGKGPPDDIFEGLSDDPEHSSDMNAVKLTLITDQVTKLKIGSSILYRGVEVGQVSSIALDQKSDDVKIGIFVQAPFRNLVNRSTVFAYQGGINAGFSMSGGPKLDISSLSTILNGAIEFTTPDRNAGPLNAKLPIRLIAGQDAKADAKAEEAAEGLQINLVTDNVTKLAPGSLVQSRGLTVGAVDTIDFAHHGKAVNIGIHIDDKYRHLINASTRFWYTNGVQADFSLFHGAKLQLSSLPVLLNGGIAFVTPDPSAPRLRPHVAHTLFDHYNEEWEKPVP